MSKAAEYKPLDPKIESNVLSRTTLKDGRIGIVTKDGRKYVEAAPKKSSEAK
jgi:hypothetical protein